MAIKKTTNIEFDTPATLDDLIEAATKLRDEVGGDAIVRTRNHMDFDARGTRVRAIRAGND